MRNNRLAAVNIRFFLELIKNKYDKSAVHELVQLKSWDVKLSPVWKGETSMEISNHPYTELPDLKSIIVNMNNGDCPHCFFHKDFIQSEPPDLSCVQSI